ncbi:MAG: site-2 protease family protein [Candidatus Omnitrophica bacterium]|nr:site-2 protease family protein [Candidatus Omnitrophota bacterium]
MNILGLLISFGLLIIAMTTHEFAHGWVANKLGDSTAKYSGRLTLNPMAHIDLFWTIILPFFLFITTQGQFVFGAAKPVPINYWALRNPKRDIIWVGLSGPLANFIFAFVLSLFLRFLPLPDLLYFVLQNLVYINIILGVFNLVPIPPLDGSRILSGLLPDRISYRLSQLEPYGFIIVILLIWMGLFDFLIWPIVKFISVLLIGH